MVLVAEKAPVLMDAVAALLSVCDGAHSRDFAGFNGPDSQYFRGLLQYQADSTQWSEVTKYKVYSKLRKYRTQLSGLGINYDELPVVQKPASLNKSIELSAGWFVVSSPWNDSLIYSVKMIPGHRFNFDTKRWMVPASVNTLPQIKKLAADYGLEVLFDDTDVLNAAPVAPVSAPKPVATISLLKGNILAVRSPYNNELRLACKAVRCYYEGSDRSWRIAAVNPLTIKKMADIAKQFNLTTDSAAAELFKKVTGETQATIISKLESDRLASIAAAKAHDAEIEIPGINGELRPFQKAGVKYSLMKKRTFVADQPGCVDGQAIIHVNRAGVGRKYTIEQAYQRFHGPAKRYSWDKSIPTYCRALCDGELHQHQIVDVLDKGERATLLVRLASGKELAVTPDHEIARSDGTWTAAGKLTPGAKVLTNGQPICKGCGSLDGIITYRAAKFRGYCRTCMYRKLRFHPRYQGGRFVDKDGYVRLSGYFGHHRAKNGEVYEHIIIMEQHLGREIYYPEQVHHINENRSDNRVENLEVVSPGKHHSLHHKHLHMNNSVSAKGGKVLFIPREDTVIEVIDGGVRHVYDIIMADPYRNFVANGFIVHNCGKTLQALATAQVANAFPVLVVCPASLKLNWRNEANKWLPQRSVCVVADGKPSKTNYDNADIVIINYDLTKKHEVALSKHGFKMIVCDESHSIKTAKTLRTKAVKAITKGNSPQYRLALTGTPVLNRPSELTSQLDFLGRLDSDFGGFLPFVKRYCNAYRDEWGLNTSGASNTKELNEKLLATCMVRRLKADVLKELPAKQRVIVPVAITNRKEYQRAESDLIAWVQEQSVQKADFLASLEGLSAEEVAEAQHSEQRIAAERTARAEHLVRIEALKNLAAQGKMEAVTEWITDFVESGQKLVVFAHHQDIVKELAAPFKAKTITGQTPIQARQDAVDGFQNKASEQVIVLNIQAGGVGLTLTAASDVVFTEYAWNPALMEQASDRCHRIGQEDTVTEWWFVAENTIDEDIINLLTAKQSTIGAVVDGDENSGAVPTSMIDAATQALLQRTGK